MAKRPQNRQQEEVPQQILLDDSFSGDSLNPALQALYSELGIEGDMDVTVHVSMLDASGKGTEAGVWRGTPDEYDLEAIAHKFGSGAYRVKVYVRNPDGTKPCRANRVYAWKLSPDDERRRLEAAQPKATETMSPADMVKAMTEAVVAAVKAAIPQQPTQPQRTRADELAEFKMLAELFRQPAAQQNNIMDILKQVTAFQEIVKTINPNRVVDKDGEVDYGAVIYKALDVFGNAVATRKAADAAAPMPGHTEVLPANVGADGQINALNHVNQIDPAAEQEELEQAMLLLKMQLKAALVAAKANGDPAAFADSVFEMLPDEAIALLRDDSEWLKKLGEVNADVLQYADWFQKVRDEILRLEADDESGAS